MSFRFQFSNVTCDRERTNTIWAAWASLCATTGRSERTTSVYVAPALDELRDGLRLSSSCDVSVNTGCYYVACNSELTSTINDSGASLYVVVVDFLARSGRRRRSRYVVVGLGDGTQRRAWCAYFTRNARGFWLLACAGTVR